MKKKMIVEKLKRASAKYDGIDRRNRWKILAF